MDCVFKAHDEICFIYLATIFVYLLTSYNEH